MAMKRFSLGDATFKKLLQKFQYQKWMNSTQTKIQYNAYLRNVNPFFKKKCVEARNSKKIRLMPFLRGHLRLYSVD